MTLTPAIIQRAQSAVLVTVDGVEYAIVSDDNHFTMDPYWQAMYEAPTFLWTPSGAPLAIGGSTTAKKVAIGGKLGIIADPFGKQGEAKYLGATLPLDGYGIVNLGVSENGKTLIGQLKGSYSSNLGIANNAAPGSITPGWNIAFPSQSHAWNVADLIHAAVAMPDKDRMSKHINVQAYPNIEQLVKNNVGLVAGTFFDDGPVVVNVNDGRMGDVVEVDLKKLIAGITARERLPLLKDIPESAMLPEQLAAFIALRDDILRKNETREFGLAGGTPSRSGHSFNILTDTGAVSTAGFESAFIDPYTRGGTNGDLLDFRFQDTGRMYLAPDITATDETTLRNGGKLADKHTTLSFRYQAKVSKAGNTTWEWRMGTVNVTAKDIPAVQTFFGDRPLDNPGYSAFTLHGPVVAGSTNNDVLDVYRIEQRLRYLGFPAMATNDPAANNTLQNFDVNGTFADEEQAALQLFEKVVRYQGSGSKARYLVPFAGADGMIESVTKTEDKNTIDWLNAYNAPHWMQFFASRTPGQNEPANAPIFESSNNQLDGWNNQQLGTTRTANGDLKNVELYGTSWTFDLMAAKQFAPTAWVQNNSTFSGSVDANLGVTPELNAPAGVFGMHNTHDLGMAMDLGISQYIQDQTYHGNTPSQIVQQVQLANRGHWSNADAQALLDAMIRDTNNRQDIALADFFSLYAVTQKVGGSRDALTSHIKGSANQEAVLNALFGDGTQTNGLINGVIIGGTVGAQNTYPDMRYALNQLGFRMGVIPQDNTMPSVQNMSPHQTHFHIYLQPPKLEGIRATNALMAADAGNPNVPATSFDAPILLAAATKMITPEIVRKINKTLIDTCTMSENPSYSKHAILGGLSPGYRLLSILEFTYGIKVTGEVKAVITQQPTHGKIAMIGLATQSFPATPTEEFQYTPEKGFLGDDKTVIEVTANGQKFRISYVIKVVHGDFDNACLPPGSDQGALTPDVQIAVEDMQLLQNTNAPEVAASWQSLFALNEQLLNSINLSFADLPAGALGQTTGSTITLDSNAAGNNWFIDPTPSDNSEYLPTSNPNEWVAKAGSAAAGKMDMLSVLLHEYGHALGIDHNPDAHDYMGTTLTAGIRRLPTPDELALMGQLVAQAKALLPSPSGRGIEGEGATVAADTSLTLTLSQGARGQSQNPAPNPFPTLPLGGMGIAFAGLLQRNRYGGLNAVLNNSTLTQYDVAANATLTNGSFSVVPASTGQAGWATQGSVNIGNGIATLNEVSTTQTRLNQVFLVNTHDRYLSFTLSGTALDDLNGAPDDAFEVALLDANSGASLLGSNGLTHSDAFLNLQVLHKINNLKLTIPL